MEAPWAPAYACLHLGPWEETDVYISRMYLARLFTCEGMKNKGIYALKLPPRRGDFDKVLKKEKWWIYKLRALAPLVLNTKLNCQVFLEE